MYTVADLMTDQLVTLKEKDDLSLAETIFHHGRLRHLPVVREGKLVGLVTHRDLLRALAQKGPYQGRTALASDVMTKEVETVSPQTPLRRAIRNMVKNKYGCLPVVAEDGKLLGILTETDVVRFAAQVVTDLDRAEQGLRSAQRSDS